MTTENLGASRRLWRMIAIGAAGAALGAGALLLADQASQPASAQGSSAGNGIQLTVGQLRINQRISSAAVRRSNESLGLLDPVRPESGDPSKTLGWRTADLRDGAITTPKVGDEAITTPKVADAAIATSKIVDGGVTTAKLGDGAVTGPKIDEGAVSTPKLGDAAVTTPKIGDGAVTGPKLGDASVTREKLASTERFRWVTKTTNDPNAIGRASDPAYSIQRINAGNYRAVFDFPVTACSWTVSPTTDAGAAAAVSARATIFVSDNNRIIVTTLSDAGNPTESGWTLQLMC
ncbi:MAG: hypothetical protein RIB67_02685 [Miltoncostaeaceae bacterium]